MIELYFAPTSNGRRAALALAEAGLSYLLHPVNFDKKPTALLERNQGGTIPVIEDTDGPGGTPIVLSQSGAIVLYLSEKTGLFMPTDARERALALQWLMFACSDAAGISSTIFASMHDVPTQDAANTHYFESRLLRLFSLADAQLSKNAFLAGQAFTVADIALYPVYAARKSVAAGHGLTHLERWGAIVSDRPAVNKAMALTAASCGIQS